MNFLVSLQFSKAMRLKDFKGSESAVERLEDGLYRIYIRDSNQPNSEIYMFDIEIDSPIEGSALYKKMNLSIDVKDKIAYSKKRLKIAEAVHRLLKKSILFLSMMKKSKANLCTSYHKCDIISLSIL